MWLPQNPSNSPPSLLTINKKLVPNGPDLGDDLQDLHDLTIHKPWYSEMAQGYLNHVIILLFQSEDSTAYKEGSIYQGDRILEVNGVNLKKTTQEEACKVLQVRRKPLAPTWCSLSTSLSKGSGGLGERKSRKALPHALVCLHFPFHWKAWYSD